MGSITKGALAMVLAGSVTFSVTNALLIDQSSKRINEENTLTVRNPIRADVIRQLDKTVQDQLITTNEKEVQTTVSNDTDTFQVAVNNTNKNDSVIEATQQNTKKINISTTPTPASTSEARTTTTASKPKGTNTLRSTAAPTESKTETSIEEQPKTIAETPTGTDTTITTNKTNNRGLQVSESAKEKSESQSYKKEGNRK
ncbi:hypothetical protein [Robertmurraya sp.]|jgi:hypothetical protein|uniref:hypothetical protein n=1 Tax=Robertmurraya sp. TaxID=2837525 RepID=UPI0037044A08